MATLGGPRLGGAAADFGARSMLLALRGMAKNLTDVPGRKSLILFTSGFPLTNEARSEVNAAFNPDSSPSTRLCASRAVTFAVSAALSAAACVCSSCFTRLVCASSALARAPFSAA